MAYNLESQMTYGGNSINNPDSLNSSFNDLSVDYKQPSINQSNSSLSRPHSDPQQQQLLQSQQSPASVYMSPPTFSPSMLYPPRNVSTNNLPSIVINLPDLQELIATKDTLTDPNQQLEWSKNVLGFVERRERTLTVTGIPFDRRNHEEEAKISPLVDHAVQIILTLAASTNSTPKPVLIEALYLRADMTSSGAYSDHRPRDPRAAFRDFEASAKGGWAPSWFRIGREYEQVPDIGRAIDAYHRGVKANDCSSLYVSLIFLFIIKFSNN